MATKPGNTTALIPQASRTLLPYQNGHHASPAMNAHRSARSTRAPSAGRLFALETAGVTASICSISRQPKPGTPATIGAHEPTLLAQSEEGLHTLPPFG